MCDKFCDNIGGNIGESKHVRRFFYYHFLYNFLLLLFFFVIVRVTVRKIIYESTYFLNLYRYNIFFIFIN